ncbi:hypothetical protein Dacsa_0988 [Dactylococcopsis salina PCC 8305]|uniref:Uncharacterized protein n=1 Tax=Dactylococcopsis salina (strain PCC 8305) TaxID=13035 RepID=K9YRZ7_DACS8|nr:hypothetical protein Dacsa_0988 [Dactylococcopsis salina PCC 8305]
MSDVRSAGTGEALYEYPNGVITLTGLTSGASIDYSGGIELNFPDNEEMDIDSTLFFPDASNSPILGNNINFDTLGTPFFSDVDNLALSLSELQASSFNNQSGAGGGTAFFDPSAMFNSETGMRFGPVPADNLVAEPVPFEAEGTMGLAALGGFFWYRKRKQAKNN